ncbi:MAG: (2Fe-2S)-binding protein [Blastocatellia bacterium]|jgi:carbon-monoxide dehydrogenase small subunit|nr:(2Fe-2S)-binding protein [Blastocatellia bacterium]
MAIKIVVNGQDLEVSVSPMKRLLDVLRQDCYLTGTKEGCGEGECGACSVLVDGEVINSCLVPVCQVEGSEIVTVEGLAENGKLVPVQEAFIKYGAAQCGICIPGMLMAAQALLDSKELSKQTPTRYEIREAIAGNLCRCTGYMKIVDAIEAAALSTLEKK